MTSNPLSGEAGYAAKKSQHKGAIFNHGHGNRDARMRRIEVQLVQP
jgi:hypothetical protein